MDARDCLMLLREIRDVAFATVDENGRPRVRIIDVMLTEGERLYFLTARGKEFYRQLEEGRWVAVTGMNRDWQSVRLEGRARRLADQREWIDRMFAENPSMNDVYPGESRYILEPFVIEEGEVEFFDLGRTPIRREHFVLSAGRDETKGFRITDQCILCGTCWEICPQKAISPGMGRSGEEHRPTRPVIAQEHCLYCGLCLENCPAGAIVRADAIAGAEGEGRTV